MNGMDEMTLSYHKSPSSNEPSGWIFLSDVLALQDDCGEWICIKHPSRVFRLRASDQNQHCLWLETLCKYCNKADGVEGDYREKKNQEKGGITDVKELKRLEPASARCKDYEVALNKAKQELDEMESERNIGEEIKFLRNVNGIDGNKDEPGSNSGGEDCVSCNGRLVDDDEMEERSRQRRMLNMEQKHKNHLYYGMLDNMVVTCDDENNASVEDQGIFFSRKNGNESEGDNEDSTGTDGGKSKEKHSIPNIPEDDKHNEMTTAFTKVGIQSERVLSTPVETSVHVASSDQRLSNRSLSDHRLHHLDSPKGASSDESTIHKRLGRAILSTGETVSAPLDERKEEDRHAVCNNSTENKPENKRTCSLEGKEETLSVLLSNGGNDDDDVVVTMVEDFSSAHSGSEDDSSFQKEISVDGLVNVKDIFTTHGIDESKHIPSSIQNGGISTDGEGDLPWYGSDDEEPDDYQTKRYGDYDDVDAAGGNSSHEWDDDDDCSNEKKKSDDVIPSPDDKHERKKNKKINNSFESDCSYLPDVDFATADWDQD